jgi:hypothetical protein
MLVMVKLRHCDFGTPSRLTVNISLTPPRRLAAVQACFSPFVWSVVQALPFLAQVYAPTPTSSRSSPRQPASRAHGRTRSTPCAIGSAAPAARRTLRCCLSATPSTVMPPHYSHRKELSTGHGHGYLHVLEDALKPLIKPKMTQAKDKT